MNPAKVSIRNCASNPNHHLWNNHGTWYVHYTVHEPDFTKARLRLSLQTKCLLEARRKRDQLLAQLQAASVGEVLATPLDLAA